MSTTETPTPRTDAAPKYLVTDTLAASYSAVPSTFARTLERELTAAKHRIAELEVVLGQLYDAALGKVHPSKMSPAIKALAAASERDALKAAPTPLDRPDAGWQPIETAPRDGTHIVTAEAGHNGFWFQEDWWPEGMDEWQFATDPIGWMPLPANPPAEPVREGNTGVLKQHS